MCKMCCDVYDVRIYISQAHPIERHCENTASQHTDNTEAEFSGAGAWNALQSAMWL